MLVSANPEIVVVKNALVEHGQHEVIFLLAVDRDQMASHAFAVLLSVRPGQSIVERPVAQGSVVEFLQGPVRAACRSRNAISQLRTLAANIRTTVAEVLAQLVTVAVSQPLRIPRSPRSTAFSLARAHNARPVKANVAICASRAGLSPIAACIIGTAADARLTSGATTATSTTVLCAGTLGFITIAVAIPTDGWAGSAILGAQATQFSGIALAIATHGAAVGLAQIAGDSNTHGIPLRAAAESVVGTDTVGHHNILATRGTVGLTAVSLAIAAIFRARPAVFAVKALTIATVCALFAIFGAGLAILLIIAHAITAFTRAAAIRTTVVAGNIDTQAIPLHFAAEGVGLANTGRDFRIVAAGCFAGRAAVPRTRAIVWTCITVLAVIANTVAALRALAAVLRAGLAGLVSIAGIVAALSLFAVGAAISPCRTGTQPVPIHVAAIVVQLACAKGDLRVFTAR